MIELHANHRRRGLARLALGLLAERYPDRRLPAFSEADECWKSVRWSRHIHATTIRPRRVTRSCPSSWTASWSGRSHEHRLSPTSFGLRATCAHRAR